MTDLKVKTPERLGVVRLRLLTPDGRVIDSVSSPGANTTLVEDAPEGSYQVVIAPLGERERVEVFEFDGSDGETQLVGEEDEWAAAPPFDDLAADLEGADQPAQVEAVAVEATPEDTLFFTRKRGGERAAQSAAPESEGVPFAEAEAAPEAADETSSFKSAAKAASRPRPGPSPASREVFIGLALDDKPFDPGGWVPARTLQPGVIERVSGFTLTFDDTDADRLGRIPRLRLSVLVDKVETRMLTPLFAGGIDVDVDAGPPGRPAAIIVRPRDPYVHALTQMLDVGTTADASALETLDIASDADPWVPVLKALVSIRITGRQPEPTPEDWMTDALVLQARQQMRDALKGSERERGLAWNQALKTMTRARRVGAPYFGYTSSLAADVLADLAAVETLEAEQPQKTVTGAIREQAEWRRYISRHVGAGAFFAWWLNPRARRRKGFDDRYIQTIWQGVAPAR